MQYNDEKSLGKLLDKGTHFPGRRIVMTDSEEGIVVHKTLEAAEKGFEVDCSLMKSTQRKIASDGQKYICKGVLFSDVKRSIRPGHR